MLISMRVNFGQGIAMRRARLTLALGWLLVSCTGGDSMSELMECGPQGECQTGYSCNSATNRCVKSGVVQPPDAPLSDAPLPDAPLPDAPLPDAPLPDAPFDSAPLLPDAAPQVRDGAVLPPDAPSPDAGTIIEDGAVLPYGPPCSDAGPPCSDAGTIIGDGAVLPPGPPSPDAAAGSGTIQATWFITIQGAAATCADVGAVTFQIIATSGGTVFAGLLPCTEMAGTTVLPVGEYQCVVRLVDAANNELSQVTLTSTITVTAGNSTDLGAFDFAF
jgi:hypothetical protein